MSTFLTCEFFSKSIHINTSMNVILPDDSSGDLPTLYLLHGYSDNYTAWMRKTSIERYVSEYKLAVVMPDVQKSFYNDFPGIKFGYKYWEFISEELIALSRGIFPLSTKREDTFVAGLSMGGFGAFKCALNKPEVFAAGASLSGALDLSDIIGGPAFDDQKQVDMILGSIDDYKGSANDLYAMAEKTAKLDKKPKLYQFCGTDDFLYEGNIRYRDFIKNLGYDYTYEETPGGHVWELWDRQIKVFIDMLELY
jgi:S-formylglutathione hydrolase FrmB